MKGTEKQWGISKHLYLNWIRKHTIFFILNKEKELMNHAMSLGCDFEGVAYFIIMGKIQGKE